MFPLLFLLEKDWGSSDIGVALLELFNKSKPFSLQSMPWPTGQRLVLQEQIQIICLKENVQNNARTPCGWSSPEKAGATSFCPFQERGWDRPLVSSVWWRVWQKGEPCSMNFHLVQCAARVGLHPRKKAVGGSSLLSRASLVLEVSEPWVCAKSWYFSNNLTD